MLGKQGIYNDMSHIQPPTKNIFNTETYVGNWYEETCQNTMKKMDFLQKRECEELAIQKSQIMTDILLKPVRLTERRDWVLYFGDSVQIVSPGPHCTNVEESRPFKDYGQMSHLALSASVSPMVVDHRPFLDTDSTITASPHLYPVVRNSYVIENPECPEDNESPVKYGDVFRIRAMPTQHWPLYLHSAPGISLHTASTHSAHPMVRFSDTKNPNTLWRIMPLDEYDKLRLPLGIPVPLQTRALLQHALSGNNLSIEPQFPVSTYFGCEYEVTVHNKKDRVRNVAWTNHWVFHTERGWRKPDPCVLAQAKYSSAINANDVTKSVSEEERKKAERRREEEGEDDPNCDCHVPNFPQMKIEPSPCSSHPRLKFINPENGTSCEGNIEKINDLMASNRALLASQNVAKTGLIGHSLPYDSSTGPQPHAHSYKLSENGEFYPNEKWNCEGTSCCGVKAPPQTNAHKCNNGRNCYDMEKAYAEAQKK